MKSKLLLYICLTISILLNGHSAAPDHSILTKTIAAAELRADAGVLKDGLLKLHPGLFRYQTEADFLNAYRRFLDSLAVPRTETFFFRELHAVIAGIGCGHTGPELSAPTQKYTYENVKFFPANIRVSDKKMFIVQSAVSPDLLLPGSEILKINNEPINEIIQKLKYYCWSDGTYKYDDVCDGVFNILYQLVYGSPDSFDLVIRKQDGQIAEYTVLATTPQQADKQQNSSTMLRPPFWKYHYDTAHHMAIIKVDAFLGWGYKKFLRRTFRDIKKQKPSELVIDLRDNGGGMDDYPLRLYRYIAQSPFFYYDRLETKDISLKDTVFRHASASFSYKWTKRLGMFSHKSPGKCYVKNSGHYNLRKKPFTPEANAYGGKVILLLNSRSFSASTEFGAVAACNKRCVIVGQETRGAYCGNNSGEEFILTLPHTGIKLFIPTYSYYVACPDCPKGKGIVPQHTLYPTARDFTGEDSIMEYVFQMTGKL